MPQSTRVTKHRRSSRRHWTARSAASRWPYCTALSGVRRIEQWDRYVPVVPRPGRIPSADAQGSARGHRRLNSPSWRLALQSLRCENHPAPAAGAVCHRPRLSRRARLSAPAFRSRADGGRDYRPLDPAHSACDEDDARAGASAPRPESVRRHDARRSRVHLRVAVAVRPCPPELPGRRRCQLAGGPTRVLRESDMENDRLIGPAGGRSRPTGRCPISSPTR